VVAGRLKSARRPVRPSPAARNRSAGRQANDIRGGREKINAVTLQKVHEGTPIGTGENAPDAAFNEFGELRRLIARLGDGV
jgi:hypothetical protein